MASWSPRAPGALRRDPSGMMGIDVEATFAKGGRELLGFLSFCVMAYHMEPLFAFFHREYAFRPTPRGALALYDCFCAAGAPARMRAGHEVLPPRNIRFAVEMEALRRDVARFAPEAMMAPGVTSAQPAIAGDLSESVDPGVRPPGTLAPTRHFNQLVARLSAGPANPIAAPGLRFNPNLTPAENLPEGRMSPAARAFVDNVWRPRVAPILTAAGFRQASNLV